MAQVSVSIVGRKYSISCDDGQEAHLVRLARYVDGRARELEAAVGQVGDARLLAMVSILLADELGDAYGELESLRDKTGAAAKEKADAALSESLDELAQRIESLAAGLEAP